MSSETLPDLAETLKNLDQAMDEFRQIKEQLRTGPVHETAPAAVAATALPVESEATT